MHQFGILASHHIFSTNPTEQRTSLHFEPWRSQAETHESHQSPSLELSVSAPKGLPDQLPNDLCKGGLLSVQIHQQKLDPPQPSKKQSSRKPVTTATAVQLRPLGGDKMATKVAKRSKHSSSPRCISTTPRRDRTMKSRVWSPLLRSKHHDTNRAVTSHPEKNKTLWSWKREPSMYHWYINFQEIGHFHLRWSDEMMVTSRSVTVKMKQQMVQLLFWVSFASKVLSSRNSIIPCRRNRVLHSIYSIP